MIGIGEGSAGVDETFWAIRTFLEALARRRPLVVMLDDVHWAEPTLLDLIDHVADWSKDVPIMVIALSRPDLLEARPTWGGGKVNAATVLLEPLTDGDSEALVANLLGSADVSADAKDRIIEAAGGNPFFVEEIVSMLIDDGLLVREGGSWLATADLSHVALPPTISALLAARLDRLEPAERETIQLASVIGGTFSIDAVEALKSTTAATTRTSVPCCDPWSAKSCCGPNAASRPPPTSTGSGTSSSATPRTRRSPNSSDPICTSGSPAGSRRGQARVSRSTRRSSDTTWSRRIDT